MANGEKDPPLGFAERLTKSFTPSQMPPAAPDGGLLLEPAPLDPLPMAEESLCEIGPCRHYHVLTLSIDAQEPLGQESGVRTHRNTVRTCYPTPGIEADLGEETVYECSRWDPEERDFVRARDLRRTQARAEREMASSAAYAESCMACGRPRSEHHDAGASPLHVFVGDNMDPCGICGNPERDHIGSSHDYTPASDLIG